MDSTFHLTGRHRHSAGLAVRFRTDSREIGVRWSVISRELAMDALKTANREANRALAKDKGGNARWNFGIYIYNEGADEEGEAKARGKEGGPS